jgi:cysteine-rich repeat protein
VISSLDAGSDGGMTPLDAGDTSPTPNEDAAAAGGSSNDAPDAAAGGDAGTSNGGSGGDNGNSGEGGDRAIGGFGNFNPNAGAAGASSAPRADSGGGCTVVNANRTGSLSWLSLLAVLAVLGLGRRRARTAAIVGTLFSTKVASALTGADTCAATTLSNDSLSSPLVINDTTVGQTDDIDHANAAPPCTEAPLCNGLNNAGSPVAGGQAFPSTGIGPDRVFRFRVDSACTLSVSMTSTTKDLNVMFSRGGCGNAPSDCSCIDDSNVSAETENLTEITVVPLTDYYIIVDGFNDTTVTPGDSFSLTLTRTLGTCNLTNEVCGNSTTAAGEACDDGNTDSCDGCNGDCSVAETGCGDGVICGAEVCDDDNTDDCDGCRGDCSAEETGCGDGFICGAEACDDSNTDSCDGCNGDCSVAETGCGDGVICPGEDCDDENTSNGDGCSALCATEVMTSIDAGVDAGDVTLPDAGGNPGNDASAAAGTSNTEPDAAAGGNGGEDGGTGCNGGDRAVGGFGNFNPNAGAGGSGTAAPAETKDSGCGCVLVGAETAVNTRWLVLFGMLTALVLRRRTVRRS